MGPDNPDDNSTPQMPEPQERDEGVNPRETRNPELNCGMSQSKSAKLTGKMAERARMAFEVNQVEKIAQQGGRFETAKQEEWQIIFNQTPRAHTYQLENGTLNEGAFVQDVGLVVFENGWILDGMVGWVKSQSAVERIMSLKESRRDWDERREAKKAEVFLSDSRIKYAVNYGGTEMRGSWKFVPADYAGKPEQVVAFREGWDAAQEDGQTE